MQDIKKTDIFTKSFGELTFVDIISITVSVMLLLLAVAYTVLTEQSVPMVLRLVFFIWLFYTVFRPAYFLPFLSSLLILEFFSIVPLQILPAEQLFTVVIVLFAVVLNLKKWVSAILNRAKSFFIIASIFLLYALVVTFTNTPIISEFFKITFVAILLFGFIPQHSKGIVIFYCSFIVVSLLLSYQGIMLHTTAMSLTKDDEVERLMWVDPNYLSILVDTGILLTFYMFFECKKLLLRIVLIIFFVIQLYLLILLTSRGGIIACVLLLLYMMGNKLSKFQILFSIGIFAVAIYFLYDLGFFDLLVERMIDDNLSSAGERTIIWTDIFNELSSRNILTLFVGTGTESSWHISNLIGEITSPHNNYLEFLVDYGIIGVVLFGIFIAMVFFKSKNLISRSIIILILIGCMSLSPFNYYVPWVLILFAIAVSEVFKIEAIEIDSNSEMI